MKFFAFRQHPSSFNPCSHVAPIHQLTLVDFRLTATLVSSSQSWSIFHPDVRFLSVSRASTSTEHTTLILFMHDPKRINARMRSANRDSCSPPTNINPPEYTPMAFISDLTKMSSDSRADLEVCARGSMASMPSVRRVRQVCRSARAPRNGGIAEL